MRPSIISFAACILIFCAGIAGCTENVKAPSVAGAFYPADAAELRNMVDGFLAKADAGPVNGRLIALIAPHAGYQYSGHVAAYSYNQLKDREIDTVILIGPSHHAAINGASVYAKGSMRTPLGDIKINEKIAKSLLEGKSHVVFDPAAFEKEHSLEVQMPFLQRTLKQFTIVPVLIGRPTRESFGHLTERLTDVLRRNRKAIIIASTDMSHYHDYGFANRMDRKTVDAVLRMSLEDVEKYLMTGEGEMCGGYPVLFTMAIARQLGATNGVQFMYANSGDVTDDKSRVVGYAAMGLYETPLTKAQKDRLLSLARDTVNGYVKFNKTPEPKIEDARLLANGAAFVTINRNHRLRGCIGNIQPVMPLYRAVIQNAVAACSRDNRFTPMTRDELTDMEVEVTVLSPLVPMGSSDDIKIGKHGLYLVNGNSSGILLPQVAEEYGWDVKTFLKQVSVKASLPEDAWKESRLFTFTADLIK